MALYCTQQNLIDRFGELELMQLTDRDNIGVINAATVANAIAMASADIDSYIGARYPLPLTSVPDVLTDKCEVLARYRLYGNGATEQVRNDYEDALKWLVGVRDGKNMLGVNSAGEEIPSSGVKVMARHQVYSDSVWDNYGWG
jgi:phage gp36-like protein